MKLAAAALGSLLSVVAGFFGVAVLAASSTSDSVAPAGGAAAACAYGDPDPERIAITMHQLGDPVDAQRWTTHATRAGIDPADTPFAASTADQRHDVLVAALRHTLNTTSPRTIATPVLVWWDAPLPDDDTDTRWQTTPVPGHDDLNAYLGDFLNEYATNPTVVAAVDDVSCEPRLVCLPPGDLGPILATIRSLESGDDYTAEAAGSTASGAYQFIDSTWGNYDGYARAVHAPPAVQDAKAIEMVQAVLNAHGNDVSAVPVIWYLGHLPDPGSAKWDTVPVPDAGNVLTPREYQTRWLERYETINTTDNGTAPTIGCQPGVATTPLQGPDCDGLRASGATYNGKVNGTLSVSDLQSSPWGPLQPAAADSWQALVDAGVAAGFNQSDFDGWSGGPGSRQGASSNHTIGLAIDIDKLAWTPTRHVPGERLPVQYAFDEPFYQFMRATAWQYGWCNPRWARPTYLNGTAAGGSDASGNGNHLEAWHWEYAGGSNHHLTPKPGDLNGPHGVPD